MDDALGVRVGEGLGGLQRDPGHLAVVDRGNPRPRPRARVPAAPQDLVEPPAGDVLHDVVVPPVVLADAVDRDDIGVVQPPGGPRLAAEPRQVGGLAQELQGHVAVERLLAGLVDDPHAAPADLADDAEVVEPLRRGGRCGRRARGRRGLGAPARLRAPDQAAPEVLHDRIGLAVPARHRLGALPAAIEVAGQGVQLGLVEIPQGEGPQRLGRRTSCVLHRNPRPALAHGDRSGPARRASMHGMAAWRRGHCIAYNRGLEWRPSADGRRDPPPASVMPGPVPPQESAGLGSQDPTSRSLLLRIKANDQDAWRRLVGLYSPLVSHSCRQWGAPDDDLPDLVQEVFAAVARGLGAYRADIPGATFRGWLRTIARNKLYDHLRRGPAHGEGGSAALVRLQELPDDDGADLSEGDTEVMALYRRAVEQVRYQFEERTWRAFWKVAIEDRSPADVATELGLSPNGVRQAKSRVLRRLKEELGDLIA